MNASGKFTQSEVLEIVRRLSGAGAEAFALDHFTAMNDEGWPAFEIAQLLVEPSDGTMILSVAQLEGAVAREDQRRAMKLRYQNGISRPFISALTDLTPRDLTKLLNAGIDHLKKRVDERIAHTTLKIL